MIHSIVKACLNLDAAQIQRFKYYAMTRLKSLEKEAYSYGYDLFKESADNHSAQIILHALCFAKLTQHSSK